MQSNPTGLCQCGCGEPAPLAKQTIKKRGYIKGQPLLYVNGHQRRGQKLTAEQRERMRGHLAGIPLSPEHRRKIAESRMGERHPFWQGDDADYNAVHKWLRRNHPKTGRCEGCGVEGHTEYAFLLGGKREVTRNREDYAELCVPCHRRFDGERRRDSEDHLQGLLSRRSGVLVPEQESKDQA